MLIIPLHYPLILINHCPYLHPYINTLCLPAPSLLHQTLLQDLHPLHEIDVNDLPGCHLRF